MERQDKAQRLLFMVVSWVCMEKAAHEMTASILLA